MKLEKELTQDQIQDAENFGQLKERLLPETWVLFRTLMITYINGFEAGVAAAQDAPGMDTPKRAAIL